MSIIKTKVRTNSGDVIEVDEEVLSAGKKIVNQLDDSTKVKLYRWIKALRTIREQPFY